MDSTDIDAATDIATRYFALSGLDDDRTAQEVARHVWDLYEAGESRTLMLANRAIDRMLRQLDAELEIESAELYVIYGKM